jgi:hypothetical protein
VAQRDAEAIRRALGADGCLAYLQGLLDPGMDDADAEDPGDDAAGSAPRREGPDLADTGLSLEVLLRALARRGPEGAREILDVLARAIEGYRAAAGGMEDSRLAELWAVWDALSKSMPEAPEAVP